MNHRQILLPVLVLLALGIAGCADDTERPMDDEESSEDGRMGHMMDGPMSDEDGRMGRMGPMMDGPMSGEDGEMPGWMMSHGSGMGEGMMADMRAIHTLLAQHETIQRQVEDIPGGVRTLTTSSDPEVAEVLQRHVGQMKDRMQRGEPIRMMDPLFRELFQHADQIDLEYEAVEGGVRATHTSENPQVVLLIRQHARNFVNEAAAEGMSRAMEPTPLPEGYGAGN